MSITGKIKIPFFLLLINVAVMAFAEDGRQTDNDSTFTLSLEVGSGLTSNYDHLQAEFLPCLGIYWKPNHLLNLGIESAYITIKDKTKKNIASAFGNTNFKASLTGLPIILTYRMQLKPVVLTGGIGAAFVNSTVIAFDENVSVNFWYYCYYFSVGYSYNLSENLYIAIEALNYSLPRIKQNIAGFNLKISYDIYQW